MITRLVVGALALTAFLPAPNLSVTPDDTATPSLTLCRLLPWLPSCRIFYE
ncbi:hypothetical protein SAMN02745244_00310 [Tessaracoccus bendigoensis DSM 12906]|uniref:Uncharacterized protein n=1 Tax=Tessaracoccus bendigoensis DSM 12906 TaxID=1123357 RepID=A0A1M6AX21_9ACTN|nr:hypothetical protein [Tessaracoccus bendigoensis]SHI41044.1 hypothetical protein SAMN02745244_00310 [Tessaracoccus bendigoensis DSM 12906]